MKLRYPTVDDLCSIIRTKVKGKKKVKVMKRDLSKAYRQLWMDPSSIEKLGFSFENQLFFDVCLSMGSKSAAYCCQRTTDSITHIFYNHGFYNVNYLDDLGAAEEEKRAQKAFECLGWILSSIGIRESVAKACAPAYIMIFLGILINTWTMTLTIPDERKQEISKLLNTWSVKKCATLREIQSLLGKLSFVCSTVRAGRIFVSRIINETRNYPKQGKRRLSTELRKDILWWKTFMNHFDGTSVIPTADWSRPDTVIATDATLYAAGGWAEPEYFKVKFPKKIVENKDVAINELELVAFLLATRKWIKRMRNRNILCYCDNQCTVEILNSGRARNAFAQNCLREIAMILAKKQQPNKSDLFNEFGKPNT